MAKPEVVTSVARSKKIVSTILMTEEPVAVIALTFKTNAITGKICLINLHTPALRSAKVFDVYRNPKLVLEGELHRLFQAEKLIKVIHDSKDSCAQLHKEYNVTFHAVFDTQVAYTLQMEERKLPPRLILFHDMYRNIVGTEQGTFYFAMKMAERSDGNLWTKRPLSDEMTYALSDEVVSLRMNLYPKVLSSLDERSLGEFETRCALAARGFRKTRTLMTSSKKQRPHSEPQNLRIDHIQAAILPNTRPLATEHRK